GGSYCCSQWGYCGSTPEFCDPNQGTLALTFDDGPHEYGIKATFFVNGHNENDYCILRFRRNFATTFKKILGVTPKYFRPPYGDGVNNANVRSAMLANRMDKL
ncbi:34349_t:CDS:2, partial [Racocetra persica]